MANRWWVYQRERFPVVLHGVIIAVFSLSATAYSSRVRGAAFPALPNVIVAFGSAFLFFLQLRILDEFKDCDEDVAYRPYRAVPRGVVSLRELGRVGVAAAAIQAALAAWLDTRLLIFLAIVWAYMALMRTEFFVPRWLKAHPLSYLGSHMVIVPLIAGFATACDWLAASASPPPAVAWFLLVSFFNGLVIEIGRKIRVPEDEERGVPTYSAAWGVPGAVAAWVVVVAATAFCAVLAPRVGWALVVVPACALMAILGWRFVSQPRSKSAKLIEQVSGAWALLVYLLFGLPRT
jgi:4-hydroxybenzoate polyprenyltransferase